MDISDNETMQSLIPQQIGMAAGMFYAIYLFYLLITGRLIETLIGSRFERSMRDAEKVVNDDPGMKDQLKKFSQDSQKLNQDMDDFCRKYPDSPLCKSSGKSSITDVEY